MADETAGSTAEEPTLVAGVPATLSRGQLVVHPARDDYLRVVRSFRDDGYAMCVDLCATDYLVHPGRPLPEGVEPERFEVAVNLVSMDPPRRARVRVQVPEAEPSLPSLYQLYPGVEAMEREAYDLFGIVFTDHPDLSRILMPDDWEGHPMRKDYGVGRIPVQFKGAPPRR